MHFTRRTAPQKKKFPCGARTCPITRHSLNWTLHRCFWQILQQCNRTEVGLCSCTSFQSATVYADGSCTLIEGLLSLSVKLHDKFFSLTFMVASLAEDFDVTGELWLTSHRATWDFASGILVLKNADLSVHLSMPLRSDHQAECATPKSSTPVAPETSFYAKHPALQAMPDILNPIFRDFRDIFEAPQPGLPPMREGVSHTIDLIPGSEPPFKPMYRLTRSERDTAQATVKELLEMEYIEPSSSPFWSTHSVC